MTTPRVHVADEARDSASRSRGLPSCHLIPSALRLLDASAAGGSSWVACQLRNAIQARALSTASPRLPLPVTTISRALPKHSVIVQGASPHDWGGGRAVPQSQTPLRDDRMIARQRQLEVWSAMQSPTIPAPRDPRPHPNYRIVQSLQGDRRGSGSGRSGRNPTVASLTQDARASGSRWCGMAGGVLGSGPLYRWESAASGSSTKMGSSRRQVVPLVGPSRRRALGPWSPGR